MLGLRRALIRAWLHRQLARIDEPEEEIPKSAVIELYEDNFEDMLVEHETILVQFKAAWCPISKKLNDNWEKAATMLQENENAAKLATINAPVRIYPSILTTVSAPIVAAWTGSCSAA